MVAEALCAMGRPDAVGAWIARYKEKLQPCPPAADPIHGDTWRSALGKRNRFADWAKFFGEQLNQARWTEVLDRWTARLSPGFSAAATHGVIRVGHAVRSLTVAETTWRMRELGDALASWAATYQELPSNDHMNIRPMRPKEAITKVPVIEPGHRRSLGNITASLTMLDDFPAFAPVIEFIDVRGATEQLLAELTEVFARVYLANAHDVLTTIVFIHGVTSHAALGNIILHVSETTARSMLRYAWQAGCALYACFSTRALGQELEPCKEDIGTLIDRAIANGDEHVIKFTEACLRRDEVAPAPAYCAAIDHALGMMRRS
jgi:hypothetical protein